MSAPKGGWPTNGGTSKTAIGPQPAVRAVEQHAKTTTLADCAAEWLAHRDLKPRTRTHYRALLDAHIAPTLGDVALGYLTAPAVRAWHASLDSGASTLRAHAYGLLHAICATAVDDELIAATVP